MSKRTENTEFICANCGQWVAPLTNGSYRNHCPFCLYSRHLDLIPGDRASNCGGLMKPVEIIYKPNKGYQIKHICIKCGTESLNISAENTFQPDDMNIIAKIMRGKL